MLVLRLNLLPEIYSNWYRIPANYFLQADLLYDSRSRRHTESLPRRTRINLSLPWNIVLIYCFVLFSHRHTCAVLSWRLTNLRYTHCLLFTVYISSSPNSTRSTCCKFQTRGHPYKLYKSRCTQATRRNFFVERVIDVWNYLPPTVNFAYLPTFKSSLKSVDFSSYLKRTV